MAISPRPVSKWMVDCSDFGIVAAMIRRRRNDGWTVQNTLWPADEEDARGQQKIDGTNDTCPGR